MTKLQAHLLLIDDDELVLKALELTLQKEGYQIHASRDPKLALEILRQKPIALILCDQRMPGLTGIEFLKKAKILRPDAIRMLITGNSDLDLVKEAVNTCQIGQYIEKPWDDFSLRTMIKDNIEKYTLQQENKELNQLLNNDLHLAGIVQETLLLGKIPKSLPGFSIDAMTIPSRDVDGDFFDFYHPLDGILDVVIGDVMGKGIPAALVGTAVKSHLLRFAVPVVRTKIKTKSDFLEEDLFSPQEILEKVQEELIQHLLNLEVFVSLFYARFNLQKKELSFIDCGAMKPIHYSNGSLQTLSGNNFPLGFVPKDQFEMKKIFFKTGDLFVFYSDGLTDAPFSQDRLFSLIQEWAQKDVFSLLKQIRQEIFSLANHFEDDLTLVLVKIEPYEAPTFAALSTAQFLSDLVQLDAVREFVNRACQTVPGDENKLSSLLQLAVNEAFCNIVKYGTSKTMVRLVVEKLESGIAITISDQGEPFDPQEIKEPSLAGDQDFGFGWYLIKKISDQLTYTPKVKEGGWNHLTLFKSYYFGEEEMEVKSEQVADILIVTPLVESLDARKAPEFKEKVLKQIEETKSAKLVMNLQELQFIDSSGLGSFLSILRALNTKGGELKLARLNQPVRSIIELVKMHKIFEIFNTQEEAVAAFAE